MITTLDRPTVQFIRDELQSTLNAFNEKHGIVVRILSGVYSPENATFKLEVALKNESGTVLSKNVTDFQKYAFQFGLKPEDLNKSFAAFDGKTYTICGLATKSYKNPILAKNAAGKVFKFPAAFVKIELDKQTSPR